ncbi:MULTISPECIES: carboxymuconolactone decarboxylase family protein [unclassified Streptomyces]|uniref:carboxymuconolactone decarboxylase family protein n=1 Tax=unclassified Streptomyces TaxID=2593676 RepID=UPI000940291C|nr:carboxymuconolactone decarboxylase family protein [Streptomyces sp. CB02058]OKI94662.1 alkylhydroperoxidase [Streptomyces sp. CB02058]
MEPRINLMTNSIGAKVAKRIYNVNLAIQESSLPKTLMELVQLRVSQINGCGWCVDVHTKEAAAVGETPVRINLVAAWRESAVFTEAERAALALAEEGTRTADAGQGVSDETWERLTKHYDEDGVTALVSLVAMINAANRLGVIARMPGGSYSPGAFAAMED